MKQNHKFLFHGIKGVFVPQQGLRKEEKNTAQKTITFQKMYPNGICQVTPTFFSTDD